MGSSTVYRSDPFQSLDGVTKPVRDMTHTRITDQTNILSINKKNMNEITHCTEPNLASATLKFASAGF